MRWSRLLAFLVPLSLPLCALTAQGTTGRITGVVTEAGAAVPISDVNVVVQGTSLGARSGIDGRFSIVVPAGRYLVRSSRIGFAARTDSVVVAAGQVATLGVQMRRVSVTLDQVVVVGYGTQRRSDLTGSVASVTPQVERTPITSLEQTLQGAAPGVVVNTASSAPGGGMSIRIRGGSSVQGNNEPLYVVDGFPIENDPVNSSPGSNGRDPAVTVPANPLATLNPSDIESIEILKDASATSIYGSRGANGVIIITTKRGTAGAPRFTLDTYTGTQSIAKRYDLLDAHDFALFANAWAQSQTTPSTPYANVDTIGAGTDWQDQIFRSAPMSSFQLGLTGGTAGDNATRYAVSGGSLQQSGIVRGSDFRRSSLRGNLDQQVGTRFHLLSNLVLSRVSSSQVPTDGSFNAGAGAVGAALQYIPLLPVTKANGAYSLSGADCPTVLTSLGLACGNIPNPVASTDAVDDVLGDTRVLANASGEVNLLPGLVFRTNLGADVSNRFRDTYYPTSTLQGGSRNGLAYRSSLGSTSWLNEYTLNYRNGYDGLHHVDALVGYTRQTQNVARESEQNANFPNDINGYNAIGAGVQAGGPVVGSSATRTALASYLGRLNYTLAGRYLLTLTGREDGNSRFGANQRWGFFPSAAAGWRVSDEQFMKRYEWIDQLKLRASYGVAGNPSISPYQSLTHYSVGAYAFGGQTASAYYPSVLGNADLGWESTKQADYGLDLSMLQQRVDLTFDYYDKRTSNLLLQVDLPTESGFATAYKNAGSITNQGIELGVTIAAIRGDGHGSVSWTSTFSFSRNHNVVTDLGGIDRLFASSINSDIKAQGSLVQVGQPLGVFYGYRTAGIFRDSAQIAAWRAGMKSSVAAPSLGSSIFVDVNGDSVITADDRTIIGDPTPKFSLGWQNNVEFRGFSIATSLDGTYGGKVFNLNTYRLDGASPNGNILADRFFDAWSPSNPTGKYNKIGSGIGFLGSDFTDELIEDGSFTRLRSVSIAHAIPASLLRGTVSSARVYVTGQNLITWTHYSGFNPDVSSLGVGNLNRGVDIGAYPLARTFIFGLNLSY